VVSTRSHARLVEVDPSEALAMDGVVDFISYKDVPANNNYDLLYLLKDEEETVFAKDTVSDKRLKPISQLRFDYDTTTIRRYHDAFGYDGNDRNYE